MSPTSDSRGVITLAYGRPRYVEQSRDLALSMQLHDPALPCALITDSTDPDLSSYFSHIIPYKPEWGKEVRQKLYLDHYSPFERTVFIDSDCLVVRNLNPVWEAFVGQSVGVPGFRYISKGTIDPCFDVDHVLAETGLPELAKFNGGLYYFARSPQTDAFFEQARRIAAQWRELRLGSFQGNGPNEEAILAVAMGLCGLRMTYLGAGGMWTPSGSTGRLHLDVMEGICSFVKEGQVRTPVNAAAGEYQP